MKEKRLSKSIKVPARSNVPSDRRRLHMLSHPIPCGGVRALTQVYFRAETNDSGVRELRNKKKTYPLGIKPGTAVREAVTMFLRHRGGLPAYVSRFFVETEQKRTNSYRKKWIGLLKKGMRKSKQKLH